MGSKKKTADFEFITVFDSSVSEFSLSDVMNHPEISSLSVDDRKDLLNAILEFQNDSSPIPTNNDLNAVKLKNILSTDTLNKKMRGM